MRELIIKTETKDSRILIGESIANLSKYLPDTKVIVITDTNVRKLYGHQFANYDVIEIGMGEKNKTLETLDYIFEKLVEFEADRSSFIVGIGGGIVCDITGIAASIYMRGVHFGFVSSTLLAQVDASVGGKNGVNFKGYKNMIGVFNQPEFVICDLEMLTTLDKREIATGFAEIVKAGLIKRKDLFEYIENNYEKALALDKDVIEKMVYDSVCIKAEVVEADEKESGERKKLNFGHTFGHAYEKLGTLTHGEAVSIGMVDAAKFSMQKGFLSQPDVDRITSLLMKLGLPTELNQESTMMANAMKKDKKRAGDKISFVILKGIGEATFEPVAVNKLEELLNDLH
ncbi:MAG: 3-dehydroquinate synthase [Bacteroidales bacterium]|nr:3-dehydroquinate synthase [Bacteroidales bacterium]